MTRTEAIFEIIKGLPEIEVTELLEMIHEHCWNNDMGHLFDELYDDSYANQKLIDENIDLSFDNQVLRDKLSALERIECQCPENKKHGETSIMCCNECGRPAEEFWTTKVELGLKK